MDSEVARTGMHRVDCRCRVRSGRYRLVFQSRQGFSRHVCIFRYTGAARFNATGPFPLPTLVSPQERPDSMFRPSFRSTDTRLAGPSLHRFRNFRGNRKQIDFFDAERRGYEDERV
jgi:hypothetical protein